MGSVRRALALPLEQFLPQYYWTGGGPETVLGRTGEPRLDFNDIQKWLAADLRAVEDTMVRVAEAPIGLINEVSGHTLGAGGKRLRPMFTLLSARAVGDVTETVLSMAAMVELIHTATLLHDDVVDHAETRRGRPTVNSVWGTELSVLIGDYVFTRVFAHISENGLSVAAPVLSRVANDMCLGEVLEMEARRRVDVGQEAYLKILGWKTAPLIAAACELGVVAAGGPDSSREVLKEYGHQVGLAFQINDDLLDLTADPQSLGKPVANDLREGKVTLPLIRTLAVANKADAERIRRLVGSHSLNDAEVEELLSIVRGYDGLAYSARMAHDFTTRAREQLTTLPASQARDALEAMTEFVVARKT